MTIIKNVRVYESILNSNFHILHCFFLLNSYRTQKIKVQIKVEAEEKSTNIRKTSLSTHFYIKLYLMRIICWTLTQI